MLIKPDKAADFELVLGRLKEALAKSENLIAEVFPVEVQELFVKYKDAFAGRGVTQLNRVMSMSQ